MVAFHFCMQFSDFQQLCDARASVRAFDHEAVSRKMLDEILACGHTAPSVGNAQPWRFHVVEDPALSARVLDACCYGNFILGGATLVVVTCDRSAKPLDGKILWNPREMEYSCAAALDHVLIAATAAGLGSCCVSLHHGPVHELLGISTKEQIIAGVLIGVPGSDTASVPHERRPLSEVVKRHE